MGRKVLIVDDAAFMRMMLKDILQKNNFEVVAEAENGKVALAAYQKFKPDIVTMDITMPEMNGIEATLALRKASVKAINGEPVPVVALTANAMPNDREKCLKAGMNGYISKPFKHEELIKILKLTINTSKR